MKTFHCQYCGNPIFFENVQCLSCGSTLAFVPERLAMKAMEPLASDAMLWRQRTRSAHAPARAHYRQCRNRIEYDLCNFAVAAEDPHELCVSCRLTRVLPNLSVPGNLERWHRLEAAKRRLFYTLAKLGLLSATSREQARGPTFEFLADLPGQKALTGHCNGVITINIAEADDAERLKRRIALHEPYRTLLGHLRHESGHFYWEPLVRDAGELDAFRALFGDERAGYAQALQAHYARAADIAHWQDRYASAYATAHPWEDWAETWSHYLHMVDLVETAASHNAQLPLSGSGAEVEEIIDPLETGLPDFDLLLAHWTPVTLLVNSLNRSLGHEDAYPFALSAGALQKLRYVHERIEAQRKGPR